LGCWTGAEQLRRAARRQPGSVAAAAAVPGEAAANAWQRAAGKSSTGSQGGVGQLGRRRNRGKSYVHRTAPLAAGGGHGAVGGGGRCVEG
jgi:hypothetical protein